MGSVLTVLTPSATSTILLYRSNSLGGKSLGQPACYASGGKEEQRNKLESVFVLKRRTKKQKIGRGIKKRTGLQEKGRKLSYGKEAMMIGEIRIFIRA